MKTFDEWFDQYAAEIGLPCDTRQINFAEEVWNAALEEFSRDIRSKRLEKAVFAILREGWSVQFNPSERVRVGKAGLASMERLLKPGQHPCEGAEYLLARIRVKDEIYLSPSLAEED